MNILCVEDEAIIARHIALLLEQVLVDTQYTFKHFEDLDDAESYVSEHPVDLVLLDLNLNGQNGFELLQRVSAQSFDTIIISANTEQAIKAFDFGVVDFVAKPFTLDRLQQAFSRLQNNRRAGNGAKYLSVKQGSKLLRIEVSNLVYANGAGAYSELNMADGSSYLHDKNLEKLLTLLPDNFIRVHKSYVVDSRLINAFNTYPGSKYEITLTDGKSLPISRQKVQMVRDLLG